jgi:micrococcal nuclease
MRRYRRVAQIVVVVVMLLAVALGRYPWPRVAGQTTSAPPRIVGVSTTTASSPSDVRAGALIEATVSRNVDGDTLHVLTSTGATEKVRFIGVNTPESTIEHEPYGKEASTYTKKRLPVGTRVWLETDVGLRDRYGRLLAYVWLSPPAGGGAAEVRTKMFNAQLLVEGYAQLMTIPPDVRYVDAFVPLQAEARAASRGLWALP